MASLRLADARDAGGRMALHTRARGLCAGVCKGEEGNCTSGDLGTYRPADTYHITDAAGCRKECLRCPRCRFFSWSERRRECSWFHRCDLHGMRLADGSYMTEAIAPHGISAASHSHATPNRNLPLLPFAAVERDLAARQGASGVGPEHTPGRANFGDVSLTEAQLDRGVSYVSRRGRLPCLVRKAARRPLTVAALGGSITSGLPFGTFTGDDHARSHWLYHRKVAHYLARQWPSTQGAALNNSFNCGVPAVGPAFSTLCLNSLLPPASDLVIVEYAINLSGDEDFEWFELLIRKLLSSAPDLAVVCVSSLRLTAVNEPCMSEQHICESFGGGVVRSPSRAEHAIASLCRHYNVPLVSLRDALGEDLGTPPYVISNFAKDCAHPTPQGHSWIAQLIVHAMRQAGAIAGSEERCRRPAASDLPAPKMLRPRTAALGGNSSTCLHGESLSAALVATSGFSMVGGRKPGLRASRAGSFVRLRVHVPAGGHSTWAHLGYLQSWRREMGRARLVCESPCACSTHAQGVHHADAQPLVFDGWNPKEKVSVTRISHFYVHLRGGKAAIAQQCVLRFEVSAGEAGGDRFMISDLIAGAHDPGPLTWAFDVAGSLLLHE